MKSPQMCSALVMISLVGLGLLRCSTKNTDQEKIASLPDLSQSEVDKLKLVPNTHMLATSEVHRRSPQPLTGPPPPCPADWTETDYTAQVTYPVTTCHVLGSTTEALAGFYVDREGPTSRVANSKLGSEVRGIAGDANAWWVCRTENGPWQGYLTESHLCIGTCSTLFSLELTNAPNTFVWSWDGSLGSHNFDPNFQFVGQLVSLGSIDYGSCHTPPPPPPAH